MSSKVYEALFQDIDRHMDEYMGELCDFLRIPGVSTYPDGNVHHGGVGADNSAIGDGDDVRIAFLVRTGHHESRNGGYRRMGADILLSHNKIAS